MNQNHLWSQEYLTVRKFWEDYDMFSTNIGIYVWQEVVRDCSYNNFREGFRTTATSKMEFFLKLVNRWKPLINVSKNSVLNALGVLDALPYLKKQATRGVQVFKWPMQKCDFNKVTLQLYWKLDAYLQNISFEEHKRPFLKSTSCGLFPYFVLRGFSQTKNKCFGFLCDHQFYQTDYFYLMNYFHCYLSTPIAHWALVHSL